MEFIWIVRFFQALVLILGALIVGLAYNGYRRSSISAMLALAIGLAVMSIGVALAGLLFEVFGLLLHAYAVQAAMTASGLGIILYSIYRVR